MSTTVRRRVRRPALPAVAGALVLAAALTACGSTDGSGGAPTTTGSGVPSGAAGQQLPDAAAVVSSFDTAGLPTTGAQDTTAQDCGGDVGCTSAVTLPGVVVRAFPTSGRAEIYANAVGVFHVVSVALTFTGDVPPAQQRQYEAAARRAIP